VIAVVSVGVGTAQHRTGQRTII